MQEPVTGGGLVEVEIGHENIITQSHNDARVDMMGLVGSGQVTLTIRTRRPAAESVLQLAPDEILRDAVTGREYRIERLLGRGGFGAAYLAVRVARARLLARHVVLKVTIDAVAWHREAYFGHLLRHVPALVEVYDSFASTPRGPGQTPLYCLVSEYVEEGDLAAYLARNPDPWPETRARREIVRLLRAVTRIHESGAVHRDITPRNVFVGAGRELKLGDFGIALHRVGRREVRADAFTRRFAPAAILSGAKSWRQADDVHQIGQVYAALLSGVAARKVTAVEVKQFSITAHAKSILQRCIGERRKCFESAAEMLAAMVSRAAAPKPVRVLSLNGKRIVFTGELSIPRAEAKKLARSAGATVENQVTQSTDVVVVGDQSPNWKAEAKGQKLLDVDHEAERGHMIAIVRGSRFLALVGRTPDVRR